MIIKNKKHIHELLQAGSFHDTEIRTIAYSMGSGYHRYWIETDPNGNEFIQCFGNGPNWSDQTSDLNNGYDINAWLSILWRDRKDINRAWKHFYDDHYA